MGEMVGIGLWLGEVAMSEYLTPEQVADRFQVTPKTVREWLRSGKLVGIKIGRGWRIKESDVARMVEAERLQVWLERASRVYPDIPWEAGQCANCGEAWPVPAIPGRVYVCSPGCKAEYDARLAAVAGLDSPEYIIGQAEVIPPI